MTYTVYHNDRIVKDKDLTPFPPISLPCTTFAMGQEMPFI